MPRRTVAWIAGVTSVALHVSGMAWLDGRATAASPVAIDVTWSSGATDAAPDDRPAPPPAAGLAPPVPGRRASRQNIDAFERGGGGDEPGAAAGILLLPRADRVTLQDSPWNAREGRQTQRIRTAPDRATLEDRRATPNPGDAPFLASGEGDLRERRRRAQEPRAGAPASRARAAGARAGLAPPRAGTPRAARADAAGPPGRVGPADDEPPRGLPDQDGTRASSGGPVAFGRPPVDEGPAATPSEWLGPVRDRRDAELLAADITRSWVEATRRVGREVGDGRGGVGGPGAPGAGVDLREREGGRAHPYGPGEGTYGGLDVADPRYVRWVLDLRARIEDRLRFPRERQLRMDQGTSLYRVHVRRDGQLARAPLLLRSSGFDDFDAAARAAIERALPSPPLPAELAPSLDVVPVTIPVEFWNPLVR